MDEQTRVIPESKRLRYNFSEGERLELGRNLCDAIREETKIAEEEATVKADFKKQKGDVTTKINEIVAKLQAGYEMRDVRTEKRIDFKANIVRIVRTDTGEIIEDRGLLNDERQMILEVARDSALDTLEQAARDAAEEKPPTEGPA